MIGIVRREHADYLKQVQGFTKELEQAAVAFDPDSNEARAPQRLPAPTPAAGLVDLGSLRDEIERFLYAVQRHQNHESGLVLESVTTDLGAGD